MPSFTHLHVHTHYSLLDGAASIKNLLSKAKDTGMNALAITDHGNLFGAIEFYLEAKEHGIKPIIGCEMYVADGSRHQKQGKQDRIRHHIILLAKNLEGYYNLCKLSSLGFLEGFYYTPRIDKELLRLYSKGLIASSACLGGEIPNAILNKGVDKAREILEEYISIFGDDFYLELQRHGLEDQEKVNQVLVEFAQQYKLKLIATNDVHFTNAQDKEAHKVLICLNTGKDINEEEGLVYSGQEYLKTPEEMAKLFEDLPEALSNTEILVNSVEEFKLESSTLLPEFPIPEGFESGDDYLRHLTLQGAARLYPELPDIVRERIDFELCEIQRSGYAGYFLIVQDFISEARKMGVLVGPGRGSAAGSVVAYCTGITGIDPIRYNLLFERFLNPERITMPDIDIDFDDEGREKVINYVVKKYGEKRVAQIVTFGTMAARSSIRDVGRVMKIPLNVTDHIAKLVPMSPGMDLKRAYSEVKELEDLRKKGDENIRKALEFAQVLEGSARHTGTHACGVIIGREDLIERVPLAIAKDTELMVTQYEGKFVETVGMLKMDFLGLKTLSIIKDSMLNILLRQGVTIDLENIPLDDVPTFELFQRGETIGIFQFESDGMRTYLRRLKPTDIEDLIAMNALYRPGPIEQIPTYIARKHGKERIDFLHKSLEEILTPTYGIMIYQEQIMQAARILSGFSLGKADMLRKAMGKKEMRTMEKLKEEFVQGAMENNIELDRAKKIFDLMMEFGKYGFNRSHSAAYGILAYRTAYLKAHYPAEFMASILTHSLGEINKITFIIEECQRMNIEVLGPDINESDLKFSVNQKGDIRFGLAAIKGIGEAAVDAIIEERNANGPFQSLFDFVKRVNLRTVNRKSMEALAMAGAFDNFQGLHRAMIFHKEPNDEVSFLEKLLRYAGNQQNRMKSTQQDLFGGEEKSGTDDPSLPVCPIWSRLEMLHREKEVTGFYISGHPLEGFQAEIKFFTNTTLAELSEDLDHFKGKEVKFAGMVTLANHKVARNGNPFGSFSLEDFNGSINLSLFSEDYLRFKHFLQEGTFLLIRGKVESRYNSPDQYEIRINQINLLQEVLEKFVRDITLEVLLQDLTIDLSDRIFALIQKHKGKCRLRLQVKDADDNYTVEFYSKSLKVNVSELLQQLKKFPEIEFSLK